MLSPRIQQLLQVFMRLPGIGPKGAERFVLYLLKQGKGEVAFFVQALQDLAANVRTCEVCQNFAESSPCNICGDLRRDQSIICVVAEPQDVAAIERTGDFHGLYHILRGVLNPLEGVGPQDLKIDKLILCAQKGGIKEIILALNPTVEGEATMNYIANLLRPCGARITRLAQGLPAGSTVEYADEATLSSALRGRGEMR